MWHCLPKPFFLLTALMIDRGILLASQKAVRSTNGLFRLEQETVDGLCWVSVVGTE